MKKHVPILAALLAALLLAGCVPAEPASSASSGTEDFSWQVVWANWSGGAMMNECLNFRKMAISSVRHLPIIKLESPAELEAFKTRYADLLTLDQGWEESPAFSEATAECGDAFFAHSALLLVYVEAGSSSYRFDVDGVDCKDGTLCVRAVQTNPSEVGDAMMSGWLIVVTAPRSLLEGVTEYDAYQG